jgi:hypothetical protein
MMRAAYEQKDIEVYFHFQQTACHLDFPLKSYGHFSGDWSGRLKPHETSREPLFLHLSSSFI